MGVGIGLLQELIESILQSNQLLFLTEPVFLSLLQKEVCATLVTLLRSCFDFPMVLRMV